jgi:hypothetical protein
MFDIVFEFIEKDVRVGVNPQMDPTKSHGAAKVVDRSGRVDSVFFQVDHPKRLRNPTNDQVRDIFKQFGQLGMFPDVIIIAQGQRGARAFKRSAVIQ